MPVWIDFSGRLVGSFELLICAGCGLSEWWAHGMTEVEPEEPPRPASRSRCDCPICTEHPAPAEPASAVPLSRRAQLVERGPVCPSCESTSAWEVPMTDRAKGLGDLPLALRVVDGRPRHRLATSVCRDCGLTRWRVGEMDPLARDESARPVDCRACRRLGAVVVPALDATGETVRAWSPGGGAPQYEARAVVGVKSFWRSRWWGRFDLRACADCGHVDWLARSLDDLEENADIGIRKRTATASPPAGPYR